MNKNLLEGEGYALSDRNKPHIKIINARCIGQPPAGVRAALQPASAIGRDSSGTASRIPRRSSERNGLHSEQPRTALEAESKPTRTRVERVSKNSRSALEQPSNTTRRVVEQSIRKN